MRTLLQTVRTHRYGFGLFVFMTAAVLTGFACVGFAKAFEWVISHRLDADRIGSWVWLVTLLCFWVAVEIIRRTARFAAGTGIPQAIFASEYLTPPNEPAVLPMISINTMVIKVVTLLLGIWVGASTGREGPT